MKTGLVVLCGLLCLIYALAALFYWRGGRKGQGTTLKAAFALAAAGCFCNFLILLARMTMTGRLPLSNGTEFLLCFTWITVLLLLIEDARRQLKGTAGVIMLIASLFTIAAFLMSAQITEISPLMPALKSPWLTIHVLTVAIAYAGFTFAAGLALQQLIRAEADQKDRIYRTIAGSFMLLSLSIIFGAIWAEQAWGSYWSWDPKETWALVTWIIYAVYLHLHQKPSWQGSNANYIVILGFLLMLFTFFGVTFLMNGLHSYAAV